MAVNRFKIKKWFNMLRGKSVYHVLQDEGKIYDRNKLKGYYNNLTDKVIRFGVEGEEIPKTRVDSGEELYFPIAIFQYALGAYDLYLLNSDENMLKKAVACADWAIANQQENGGWITFSFESPNSPYSSMAQGEGISLLLRVYQETQNEKYLLGAKKAKDFMIIPIEAGGTTQYLGEDVLFFEFTDKPLVLNGWIFSLWGLWDYAKYFDDIEVEKLLQKSLSTLEKKLPSFDMKYWSKYDIEKRITSPFYHRLHIAQLRVMYDLTGKEIYLQYANKWEKYQKSFWKRNKAFIKKAWQKVVE